MAEKMSLRLKVRNYHIDSYGHVNNANYLTFLEEARSEFLDRLGYGLVHLNARAIQVFITEIQIQYKAPAKLGDELIIYGWFCEISSRRATWQHEIHNSDSGALVATAKVSGMFLSGDRIVSIPSDIRESMNQLFIDSDKAP